MKSLREGIFESNSSSMHCLTVAVDSYKKDKKYIKKYLKPFLQEDGSYKIEITLNDDLVDEGSFTIRHYIPHYSIHDKLMYAFAVIIQHYQCLIQSGPYRPYPCNWIKDEKEREEDLKKRLDKYYKKKAEWESKGLHAGNVFFIKQFEKHIHDFEGYLAEEICYTLFGKGPDYEWNNEKYVPKEEDKRPAVTVKLNYWISETDEINICPDDKVEWFSTGCYGNEEFYAAVCASYWDLSAWILNPYSAVLAGGDEQDDEDYLAQRKEAKRLLDESWEKYKANYKNSGDFDTENIEENYHLIMNPGKAIWPIGG